MARTGWLGSNNTAKVQEVIETETQLRAALEAGCAGLVAENERLREALKPFAAFADLAGAGLLPADHVITLGSGMAARQLTIGDCRNARTALRGDREQGEG
jgi:hypothetical protein